jgi:hypothetical protein
VGNFLADVLLTRTPTDTLSGAPYEHKLTTPVLNLQRRLEVLAGGNSRSITLLKELKTLTSPTEDAKVNEIITVLTVAKNEAKK